MGDFIMWVDYIASPSQFAGLFVFCTAMMALIEDIHRRHK